MHFEYFNDEITVYVIRFEWNINLHVRAIKYLPANRANSLVLVVMDKYSRNKSFALQINWAEVQSIYLEIENAIMVYICFDELWSFE